MRPNTIVACFVLAVVFNVAAWGQALRPSAEVLEPFVNDHTVLVAHGDMTKANLPELEKSVWAMVEKGIEADAEKATTKSEMHADFAKTQERLEQFTQAGGRDMYLVAEWATNSPGAVRVLIPVYGDDSGSIMDWMDACWPGQPTAEVVGKTIVVSLSGKQQGAAIKPSARPELQQALDSAGAAPLTVMLIPTDGVRKLIEQQTPVLPPPVGGPSTALTQGVKWASLAVELPPKLGGNLTIQSPDAAAAEALRGVIGRGLDRWGNMAGAAELVKPLAPTQQGDRLTASVSQADVDKFVAGLAPALRQGRHRANQAKSANNIRQLLLGCIMYVNDHKGQWPPTLAVLMAEEGIAPQVLINPDRPAAKPGYIYVRPADPKKADDKTLVFYEAFDKWPGQVNVGFADAHVMLIRDQQQFDQLLKAAGK